MSMMNDTHIFPPAGLAADALAFYAPPDRGNNPLSARCCSVSFEHTHTITPLQHF